MAPWRDRATYRLPPLVRIRGVQQSRDGCGPGTSPVRGNQTVTSSPFSGPDLTLTLPSPHRPVLTYGLRLPPEQVRLLQSGLPQLTAQAQPWRGASVHSIMAVAGDVIEHEHL